MRPATDVRLEGRVTVYASNLLTECQMFSGDRTWARTFEKVISNTRCLATEPIEG